MMSQRIVDFKFFFFQAEGGIRDLVRSRGLGDVYKRQGVTDAGDLLQAVLVKHIDRARKLSVLDVRRERVLLSLIHI